MGTGNRGKGSSKKRAADTQGADSAKKSKDDNSGSEWKIVEINMPDGDDASSDSDGDDELIQEVYGYIDNNAIGIHLTLSDDGNVLRVLDFKDENNVKKLKHTLEDPYDCCFLHTDLQSAILIREYNEEQERELEYDNVIVAEAKNFLRSDDELECNILFQYNPPDATETILNRIVKYRKSGNVLIIIMEQYDGEEDKTNLLIVTLDLSAKKQKIWHDSDRFENILFCDEHYLVATVSNEDEQKMIKSYKLGDGTTNTKVIATTDFEDWNAVYRIYYPKDLSKEEIWVDNCVLNDGEEKLIDYWGEDEGNLFYEFECEENLFVVDKNKRMLVRGDENKILLTGYGDRPIKFTDGVKLLDEDNLLPEKFIVSYNLSASSIAIYDAKTSELLANLLFPYFSITSIAWNSDQSAFIATNSEDDQYYIIKQV